MGGDGVLLFVTEGVFGKVRVDDGLQWVWVFDAYVELINGLDDEQVKVTL